MGRLGVCEEEWEERERGEVQGNVSFGWGVWQRGEPWRAVGSARPGEGNHISGAESNTPTHETSGSSSPPEVLRVAFAKRKAQGAEQTSGRGLKALERFYSERQQQGG